MTTELMRRRRLAHPTKGLYEAAELQFWWTRPRGSDNVDQLFWLDDDGAPVAAAILADFTDGSSLVFNEVTFCPIVMPDATTEQTAWVVDQGLAACASHGFASVELEVDSADETMLQIVTDRGFTLAQPGVLVECWRSATTTIKISPLDSAYRLTARAETRHLPHHMERQPGDMFEERLRQTSLYRPDLDLVILDEHDNTAGYGLFWFDPVTATGVVEPMRTMDEHQQQGIARHILTAGIDRLTRAGAERIAICYEPDNPASGHLYRSVGFVPCTTNDLYSGPTHPQGAPNP